MRLMDIISLRDSSDRFIYCESCHCHIVLLKHGNEIDNSYC